MSLIVLAFNAAPAAAEPKFGFNNSYATPPAAMDDELNRLEAGLGAKVDRIVISWADVDRDPTVQDWLLYDRRIASIRAAGMRPLVVVQGSPEWAHPNLKCFSSLIFCPPDSAHLDDWERFNYQVALRYPDAVAIEVWNEPSWHGAWATQEGPNPERYTDLFQASAGAIHFANPAMPVLMGSLTYSQQDRDGGNISIPTFVRRFAQAGGFGSMRPIDGIGIHVYPWIDEMETLDTQFATIMRQIRAARNQYAPDLDIWVTETGATTTGPNPVSERQQARTILHILDKLMNDNDLGAVLIHTSVEPPNNPQHPAEEGSGILKWADLKAKLAYCALLARAGGNPASYPGCPADISDAIGIDLGGGGGGGGGGAGDGGRDVSTECEAKIAKLKLKIANLKSRRAFHRPLAAEGNRHSQRALRKIRARLQARRQELRRTTEECSSASARAK